MLLLQNSLLKLVFNCFLYSMVYTCCVPGSKTGYKSEKLVKNALYLDSLMIKS